MIRESAPGDRGGGLVDLTNEDVADILALLDSLPYDALDLETPRFRLTLRRAPAAAGPRSRRSSPSPRPGHRSPDARPARRGIPRRRAGAAERGPARGRSRTRAARRPPTGWSPWRRRCRARSTGRRGRGRRRSCRSETRWRADTVVAIVETMKLMNSVHAGTRGPGGARSAWRTADAPSAPGHQRCMLDPSARPAVTTGSRPTRPAQRFLLLSGTADVPDARRDVDIVHTGSIPLGREPRSADPEAATA